MNKILFLDIDGVLNNTKLWHQTFGNGTDVSEPSEYLSSESLERLSRLVEKTNCVIVISSSWRATYSLGEIKSFFVKKGFKYPHAIVSATPNISVPNREAEILSWLNTYKDAEKFAILDDVAFQFHKFFPNNFVQTNAENGLTDDNINTIIQILNDNGSEHPKTQG